MLGTKPQSIQKIHLPLVRITPKLPNLIFLQKPLLHPFKHRFYWGVIQASRRSAHSAPAVLAQSRLGLFSFLFTPFSCRKWVINMHAGGRAGLGACCQRPVMLWPRLQQNPVSPLRSASLSPCISIYWGFRRR